MQVCCYHFEYYGHGHVTSCGWRIIAYPVGGFDLPHFLRWHDRYVELCHGGQAAQICPLRSGGGMGWVFESSSDIRTSWDKRWLTSSLTVILIDYFPNAKNDWLFPALSKKTPHRRIAVRSKQEDGTWTGRASQLWQHRVWQQQGTAFWSTSGSSYKGILGFMTIAWINSL